MQIWKELLGGILYLLVIAGAWQVLCWVVIGPLQRYRRLKDYRKLTFPEHQRSRDEVTKMINRLRNRLTVNASATLASTEEKTAQSDTLELADDAVRADGRVWHTTVASLLGRWISISDSHAELAIKHQQAESAKDLDQTTRTLTLAELHERDTMLKSLNFRFLTEYLQQVLDHADSACDLMLSTQAPEDHVSTVRTLIADLREHAGHISAWVTNLSLEHARAELRKLLQGERVEFLFVFVEVYMNGRKFFNVLKVEIVGLVNLLLAINESAKDEPAVVQSRQFLTMHEHCNGEPNWFALLKEATELRNALNKLLGVYMQIYYPKPSEALVSRIRFNAAEKVQGALGFPVATYADETLARQHDTAVRLASQARSEVHQFDASRSSSAPETVEHVYVFDRNTERLLTALVYEYISGEGLSLDTLHTQITALE